jgi:NAD(P)-dependent dehydrogenase (short-subunit alcohol dehydrogenase family)
MAQGLLLRRRFDGALAATLTGIADRFLDRGGLVLREQDRLDQRTVLVTGGNRGLGLAASTELARRGAHVIVACRSGGPEAARAIQKASLGGVVESVQVDFTDLGSIERLVDELAEDGVELDVTVLNAGVVPSVARKTASGLEEMFQVNFLANVLFVRRAIERGVIKKAGTPGRLEEEGDEIPARTPRVIFVSSESHRGARAIDWASFGEFKPFTMGQVVAEYGHGKLLLETFAAELSRRVRPGIEVHTTCPGAVRTGIAREAPRWAQPALGPVMQVFFRPPEEGCFPLVYLATSPEIAGETGLYVHVKRKRARDERADDVENGRRIWEASEALLARLGHRLG